MSGKILQDGGDHHGLHAVWGFGHNTFIIKLWKNLFFFFAWKMEYYFTQLEKGYTCSRTYFTQTKIPS